MPLRESPLERAVYRWCALGTVLGGAGYVAWIHQRLGEAGLWQLLGLAGSSLAFVGKFVIFVGLKEGGPRPAELALLVFLLDLGFGFLLTSRPELLDRVPMLGQGLVRARARAQESLVEFPGLARKAFFGVALYVFLPLAATGAITGAFVARVLGLSRLESIAAIALGSAATATLFTLLATFLGARAEELLHSPILAGSSTLLLLFLLWRFYVRLLARLKS